MKYLLVIVLGLIMIAPSAHGQQRKIDKLEMLYDQGNYEIVYRRSKRYMAKPEYDFSPAPKFYNVLSMYRLAEQGDIKFTHEKSLKAYNAFLQSNPGDAFLTAHQLEIKELENGLISHAKFLVQKGRKENGEAFLAEINRVFSANHQKEVIGDVVFVESGPKNIEGAAVRDSVIWFSQQFIGVPYQWGGTDPSGFDCSGFTQYVLKEYGIDLPRIAGDQYAACSPVDFKDAKKGDLVFFGKNKGNVEHVGIVVSNPGEPLTMIHASSSRGIMISNIEDSSYWKPKLLYAAAILD